MRKIGLSPRFVEMVMRGVRSVIFQICSMGLIHKSSHGLGGYTKGAYIPYHFSLPTEGLLCLLKIAMREEEMT
jgi:hypothetical protein